MSTESTVNDLITASRTTSKQALDRAIGYTDTAQTAAETVITNLPAVPTPTQPNIVIPPFSNPNQDLSSDFLTAYGNAIADFGPGFTAQFQTFLTTHFPTFDACLQAVDTWVCNAIQVGGTGLKPDIENAIWQRDRDRLTVEAMRQKADVLTVWAGRGFSFPPGVLVELSAMVDQDLANKTSTASREVAIKQAEMEIENLRLAIAHGVQLRLGVMQATIEYVKAYMQTWALAIEKAKALVEAKRFLWQASAAYYQALIAAAELQLKYDEIRINSGLAQGKLFVEQIIGSVTAKVNAAISAAESLSHAAAAALGAQVSLAKLGHETVDGSTTP